MVGLFFREANTTDTGRVFNGAQILADITMTCYHQALYSATSGQVNYHKRTVVCWRTEKVIY
ncbi:MAG: hypothetical protein ACPG52_09105 [Cognaticolwellia sp.]